MMRLQVKSLGIRLLVSVLALSAVILITVGMVSYLTTRAALVSEAQTQVRILADNSSQELTNQLTNLRGITEAIAAYEARSVSSGERIDSLVATLPEILRQAPNALATYVFFDKQVIPGRDYSAVWYVRRGGKIEREYPNVPGEQGFDPSKQLYDYYTQSWFTDPMKTVGQMWSAPYFDAPTNAGLVSSLSSIRRDGKAIGVVGMDIGLTDMQTIIAGIHPTEHSYAVLISGDGTVIANPSWPDSVLSQKLGDLAVTIGSPDLTRLQTLMLDRQAGLEELTDPRTGQIAWAAYKPVEGTDWSIAVIIPKLDLLGAVDQLQTRVVLIGVFGMLLLAGLLYMLARSTTRPLGRLTSAAQAMARGDLGTRVDLRGEDEIGVLGASFNTMAQALEERVRAEQASQAEIETQRQVLEQTVDDYLQFVQQVARGNLAARMNIRQDGALGQLGSGLNGMVESLHAITSQVQEAASNMAASAAEILSATTQQAASAAEQSAAISQTNTTIEEVKAIAQQTAQQAGRVAQDSQSALEVARQGTLAVEETVGGMGQIRTRVESIAQTILSLSEQTQAISAIITTVNELADQSNLLALNAAIEAARAGEQGKSFAVVAQHVRDLAERSKGATGQVREILGEIQRATNAAVLVTEEGTKGVEVGARLAGQAGQVIHRIAAEVEQGAQSNVQMAAAAQQQTAGMDQIGQAMTSIQQATTQALASTRQAERATQDLHGLAQTLQKMITSYTL